MDEKLSEVQKTQKKKRMFRCLIGLVWLAIICICYINRSKISVDGIVNSSPSGLIPAVLLMWCIFAMKSVTIVIYCGVLYIADGILFPIALAIPVSVIGTAIMITIPFFIGRGLGTDEVDALIKKYPKLGKLHDWRRGNDFFFSFIIRIIGPLPSDPLSVYMGATGTQYGKYLCGSVLGMLPAAICITVMGTSITEPGSPVFLTALGVQLLIAAASILLFARYSRRKEIKGFKQILYIILL